MNDSRRLGDYVPLRHLRWGTTAELVLARHVETHPKCGREIVLKLLAPHLAADPVHAERLVTEGRLGRVLRHPGLIETQDVGHAGGVPFIVLEHIDGCDLQEVVERRSPRSSTLGPTARAFEPLPLAAALRIGAELCAALDYLHGPVVVAGRSVSIVHRDVAPDNLMIGRAGEVKLIDLGLAAEVEPGVGPASAPLTGTIAYAAPEQLAGRAVDGRADVFSVGVILHELLTGRRLFARANEAATLVAVLEAQIEPLRALRPDAPSKLERLLEAALERDPERRLASAAELAAELRGLLGADRFDLVRLLPANTRRV